MNNFKIIKETNKSLFEKIQNTYQDSITVKKIIEKAKEEEVKYLAKKIENAEMFIAFLTLEHVNLSPSEMFHEFMDNRQ